MCHCFVTYSVFWDTGAPALPSPTAPDCTINVHCLYSKAGSLPSPLAPAGSRLGRSCDNIFVHSLRFAPVGTWQAKGFSARFLQPERVRSTPTPNDTHTHICIHMRILRSVDGLFEVMGCRPHAPSLGK